MVVRTPTPNKKKYIFIYKIIINTIYIVFARYRLRTQFTINMHT